MKCNTSKINPWQTALINAVTDPKELLELLELDPALLPAAQKAAKAFPLKVPRNFIKQMKKGDSKDPLLLQVLPLAKELHKDLGYALEPLNESQFNPIPGLLHKYHGRVLLTLTGVCGINCRYCFRRNFAYGENNPGSDGWNKVLDYIRENSSISEVILSGGDPLIANDQTLKNLVTKLVEIKTIKRLRIHSRMPIVLPERVTLDLIDAVIHPKLKTVLVVHCNHPNEITIDVKKAMKLLANQGVTLLNQTVLLKNINDRVEILTELSEALFETGILPYYLHVLDKVQGAAHFDLGRNVAFNLHKELAAKLSGYLVPKLVCEQPGAFSKTAIEFCTE